MIPARFQLCLSHDIFRRTFAELFTLLKVNHPQNNTVCPCWGEMKSFFFPHVRQTAATSPARPPHPGKQSNHFCYYTCYQHSTSLPASPFHLSQLSSFLSECTSSFSNFPFGGFNTQITITLQCTHSNPNFPFTGFSSFSEEKIVLHYISIHLFCLVKCNIIPGRIWAIYLFICLSERKRGDGRVIRRVLKHRIFGIWLNLSLLVSFKWTPYISNAKFILYDDTKFLTSI